MLEQIGTAVPVADALDTASLELAVHAANWLYNTDHAIREKLINDFFVAIEGDALRFSRDHEHEWLMPLDSALHSAS